MNTSTPDEEEHDVAMIVYLSIPPMDYDGFYLAEVLVDVSLPGEIVRQFRRGFIYVRRKPE